MESYNILVYLLFALAAIDLVVGVSNDAVNFLNSAIGSKVASFRTILIIASLGILAGALFSSGMMEVARKGIFNPGFFSFETIMFLFLAVMLTDIILLDLYNTLGMPTSTTVSIVFELLGAAFAIGLLHSFATDGGGFSDLGEIINWSSAIKIISGIFLSVLISFTVGALVQYVTRIIFSMNFEKNMKRFGAIFSGIAITAITYFLLIKGAKGASFMTSELKEFIKVNTWPIVGASMVFWSLFVLVITKLTKVNHLKIVVLLGTFSLAMAFAGNDLVNFIGVAIAGKQSFAAFMESGMDPNMSMAFLAEKQMTEPVLLTIAGLIMVVTLWVSAKAKKVTETEVNLSRQDDGDERFKPNVLSRTLVKFGMNASNAFYTVTGRGFRSHVDQQYAIEKKQKNEDDRNAPAFDLIRASVNLMVASILIAYATSLKLPLSTTYVSFMVAMGTSLADRAWGRESAVYRVAGVLNVIGGWLLTALIAFVASSIFATIIYFGKFPAVALITLLAFFLLLRSHITFKRKSQEEEASKELFSRPIDFENVIAESKINTGKNISIILKATSLSLKSLVGENRDILVRSSKQIEKLKAQNEKLQDKIIKYIKKMNEGQLEAGRLYILVFDLLQDLGQSANLLSSSITKHVINHHPIPDRKYLDILIELDGRLDKYMNGITDSIENLDFKSFDTLQNNKAQLIDFLNEKIDEQISIIQTGEVTSRNGMLRVRVLLEARDIVNISSEILTVYVDYAKTR